MNPKNALGWDEAKRNCEEQKGSRNSTPQKTTMDFAHKLIHAIHQLRMQIPLNTNCTTWELAQGTHYIANYAHNCSQLLTIQSNKWFQLPEQFIQHASPSTPQNWKKSLQQQQSLSLPPIQPTTNESTPNFWWWNATSQTEIPTSWWQHQHRTLFTSPADHSFIHSHVAGPDGDRSTKNWPPKNSGKCKYKNGTPRNYITQILLSLQRL